MGEVKAGFALRGDGQCPGADINASRFECLQAGFELIGLEHVLDVQRLGRGTPKFDADAVVCSRPG